MEILGVNNKPMSVNRKLVKAVQGTSTGDMKKSVYDPTGSVEAAGGIPDYVDANGGKIDIIKVNGTAQTITNKTVDIAVPTNNNQLVNGAGYISEIPIASTTQLGGVKIGNGLSIASDGTLSATGGGSTSAVTSVNGKTGDVELTASDVGALPSNTTIPTPFYAGFGVHGEDTYDENPTHGAVTTYENILEAYNSGKPCYAKIKVIGTEYTQTMIAPLAYVDTANEEVGFALTKMTQGDTPEELIICYANINGDGEADAYVGSRYTGSSINNFLPSVSTSDNGKFLRVINGAWAATTIDNANGVSF
mgnify:CR=1 FL=1